MSKLKSESDEVSSSNSILTSDNENYYDNFEKDNIITGSTLTEFLTKVQERKNKVVTDLQLTNSKLHYMEEKCQILEKALEDKNKTFSGATIKSKYLFEVTNRMHKVDRSLKGISEYIHKLRYDLMQIHEANACLQDLNIGDYVYFRHGSNYHDYPMGKITEILKEDKIYKINYNGQEYECNKNEIYKTNGQKPTVPDYNIETNFDKTDNLDLSK